MLSLRPLANGLVSLVSPRIPVTVQKSTGSVMSADGTRRPSYQVFADVMARLDQLTPPELSQVEGLNLQGARQALYLDGKWRGLVRASNTGGDLVTLPDGSVWLAVAVLEDRPTWTRSVIVLQNGA